MSATLTGRNFCPVRSWSRTLVFQAGEASASLARGTDLRSKPQQTGAGLLIREGEVATTSERTILPSRPTAGPPALNGKIMVRQVRHDAMEEVKKEYEGREDDIKRLEREVQKIIDDTMEHIEDLGKQKEKELLQI